jgi:MoaA/NifB/PqqE/SkfB family radical SAM enzyme
MLKAFKQDGKVPLLASNVVINKYNMKDIPLIVEALSRDGYWINLCTIQKTDNYLKHFSKTDIKKGYLFTDSDKKDLAELSDTLMEMKDKGYKISVPYQYLKDIPLYGINSDWQCRNYYQLRIDSDGALMLCNEFRMKKNEFNVENLDSNVYTTYIEQWYKERKEKNCDGCYWSCFVQAKDNIENNQLEFHYVEN